jgi:hypothetical protein
MAPISSTDVDRPAPVLQPTNFIGHPRWPAADVVSARDPSARAELPVDCRIDGLGIERAVLDEKHRDPFNCLAMAAH